MTVRLTKIIATLGPASGTKKMIRELVKAGVNVFRLNLSHGDHEAVRQWIRWIRETEEELKIFIGILLDLQGPKIRVGKFANGCIELKSGKEIVFTTENTVGHETLVPIQYKSFHKGDAFSRVGEVYFHMAVHILGGDGQLPSVGHGVLCIIGQIQENALQLLSVGQHQMQVWV